ncbi:MAG TPA: nuclear transport factor 2 family protein [Puia sp.]|nr:nuclear transport factor 2 family protein [Puia sp.]
MKFLIFSFCILSGLTSWAQTASDDIALVKKLNEDWIHSYPGKDTATMSRIFADDLIMITPNGSRIGKQDILNNVSSPSQQVKTARVDKAEVKLVGNTALIFAEASFVTIDNSSGKEMTGRTSYLDIYEKRHGKWVAIAAHVTYLGQ